MAAAVLGSMMFSCAEKQPVQNGLSISVALPSEVKATLGADGFSLFWSEGDVIALNGQNSKPLSSLYDGKKSATFSFDTDPGAPYKVVVPFTAYATYSSIFMPSRQVWTEGNISANSIVLTGISDGSLVNIHHLNSYLKLQLRQGSHTHHAISYIAFYGNNDEAVAGTFDVEFDSDNVPHLSHPSNIQTKIIVTGCPQSGNFVLAVPALEFSKGFTIDIVDEAGHFMRKRMTSPVTLTPGTIYTSLGEIVFNPTGTYISGGVETGGDVIGYVADTNGRPIENVSVSNGMTSVSTDANGAYSLPSAEFVYLSVPSGYEIPYDNAGFPAFYKKVTNTSLPYNFTLEPLKTGSQTEWTLCAMADPQVHSEDISRFAANIAPDMKQTLGSMSNVYSVILGDVLWNSASGVWTDMKGQLSYAKTGAHFFAVPGNHDLYDAQSATQPNHTMFTSHFGPENYSFNRGDVHVVCVNNIITEGKGQTEYKTGLSDDVYAWLQSDLALVDKSKAVCLCMHANVTCNSNVENPHYSETLALLSEFAAAYILTGHLHRAEKFSHTRVGGV